MRKSYFKLYISIFLKYWLNDNRQFNNKFLIRNKIIWMLNILFSIKYDWNCSHRNILNDIRSNYKRLKLQRKKCAESLTECKQNIQNPKWSNLELIILRIMIKKLPNLTRKKIINIFTSIASKHTLLKTNRKTDNQIIKKFYLMRKELTSK